MKDFLGYGVYITFPCPKCGQHNFITNYNSRQCGVGECNGEIQIKEDEINKLLIKELVKDRDNWKNNSLNQRIKAAKSYKFIGTLNNSYRLVEKI